MACILSLGLLLLPSAPALAKPGHGTRGERNVVVGALARGASPGDPWTAEITVLGRDSRPVTGVNPVVSLTDAAGGRYYAAGIPTGDPGGFRAQLAAPAAGLYRVTVDDGLGVEHSAGVTRVLEPAKRATADGPEGIGGWVAPLAAGAASACLLLLAALRRRRNAPPASAA